MSEDPAVYKIQRLPRPTPGATADAVEMMRDDLSGLQDKLKAEELRLFALQSAPSQSPANVLPASAAKRSGASGSPALRRTLTEAIHKRRSAKAARLADLEGPAEPGNGSYASRHTEYAPRDEQWRQACRQAQQILSGMIAGLELQPAKLAEASGVPLETIQNIALTLKKPMPRYELSALAQIIDPIVRARYDMNQRFLFQLDILAPLLVRKTHCFFPSAQKRILRETSLPPTHHP